MRLQLDLDHTLSRPLRLELGLAALLLTIALAWEHWRHLGLWQMLHWSFWCLPWSLLAAFPSMLLLLLLESPWRQRVRWLREFREQVTTVFTPILQQLRWPEIVLLSGLAGLSEEVFFRGIVQQEIGLELASLVFGLLHAVSLPYMVWATLMGGYLGWLLQLSQNLWLPILVHAIVDMLGLWYIHLIATSQDGRRDV